jgi:quercetin dioxygenase-like cupin family protein
MESVTNQNPTNSALHTFGLTSLMDQMKQKESWVKNGRNASTLSKLNGLCLVLNIMKAGTGIKPHQTKRPISVHCIEGQLKFNTEEESVIINKVEILTLQENTRHSVNAIQETGFLLI